MTARLDESNRPRAAGSRFLGVCAVPCPRASPAGVPCVPLSARPPTVGRGSADSAEPGRVCGRVDWTGVNLQSWLQSKSRGIRQPRLVVSEGCAFFVLTRTGPQVSHQLWVAVEINVDESLSIHQLSFVGFRLRATRIRTGKFSSSCCKPTGSLFGAARSRRSVTKAQAYYHLRALLADRLPRSLYRSGQGERNI